MTDWAPVWDYQWWKDIAFPAVSSFGALGIGVGSVWLAVRSQRFTKAISQRDQDTRQREAAAGAREVRARVAAPLNGWTDSYLAADPVQTIGAWRIKVEEAVALTPGAGRLADAMEDLAASRQFLSHDGETRRLRTMRRHFIGAWVQEPSTWLQVEDDSFDNAEDMSTAQELAKRWRDGRFERM